MRQIDIREANGSDARQCSAILCASIRELCTADHNGDLQIISQWISNKTEDNLQNWILNKNTKFFVSASGDEIHGVDAINLPDELALNYVSPKFRYKGVSRAMLAVLENALRESGCAKGQLTSTMTAHEFYLAAGWSDVKQIRSWPGLNAHIMEKVL